MNVIKIREIASAEASLWRVLHTTDRSQVAIMNLAPGEASSEGMSVHPGQDQLLYLLEGELFAEIDGKAGRVGAGELAVVPAGAPHRFVNQGDTPARSLNIYTPPAY